LVIRHFAWVELLLGFTLLPVSLRAADAPTGNKPAVIVVVGAAGEDEFATNFVQQATLWRQVCERAGCRLTTIGLDAEETATDLAKLTQALETEPRDGIGELWLVLVGHGTWDGKEARFNLRGPDLTVTDLALALQPFSRPLAVINTASASAPFINRLSGTNRVIVTATRSGSEENFTRFGLHFAEALTDLRGDLDQDGQTSLLEAFLSASHRVAEFYKVEGRLASEHALIDDNGDGLGTPAEWFRGIRAVRRAKVAGALDSVRAHQFHLLRSEADQKLSPEIRARRDALERQIADLRDRKDKLPEADYFTRLEQLLLELAAVYELRPQAAGL